MAPIPKGTAAQRDTLVDNTAEQMRRMILVGELQPGEQLPTRDELAARFDVGRSTINQAIQVLSSEGLLDSRPGKGTWVRADAIKDLFHVDGVKARLGSLDARMLFDTRATIEVALTERAAVHATEEECRAIWDALAKMEQVYDDDDAFVEADWLFHMRVATAAHNSLLAGFYQLCRRLLQEVISDLIKLPSIKTEAIALQRGVAEAIAEHDLHKARAAALAHMYNLAPAFGGEAVRSLKEFTEIC